MRNILVVLLIISNGFLYLKVAEQLKPVHVGQEGSFSGVIDDVMDSVVSIRTDKGHGTGVVYSPEGLVITNRHVVEGAWKIDAVFHDGRRYRTSLVGHSLDSDLAVLRILSSDRFDFLEFAEDAKLGEDVIAIGNPRGLSFSVTQGIISALDRQIDSFSYLQTDVPINPGNSGGPLINKEKKVVGITTLKFQGSEGLGFAIPAQIASDVAFRA